MRYRRLHNGLVVLLTTLAISPLMGCASVQINPSRDVATTQAPFEATLGLGTRISVAEGAKLDIATVDGKAAFCTSGPAYFSLGEARPICFFDSANSGYLDKYYVLGTLRSLTYDAHVPYSMIDNIAVKASHPLDLEYVRIQRLRDPQFGMDKKEVGRDALADDQLAAVRAKRDAGKKLTAADRTLIAVGDQADAAALQRAEAERLATIEQDRRYDANRRAVAADQVICDYESHSTGYVGYHRSIGAMIGASIGTAIEQENVRRLCLDARAAARY